MKGITVRFSNSTHRLIIEEARREGITPTSYIREAALARVLMAQVARGEQENAGWFIQDARDQLARDTD